MKGGRSRKENSSAFSKELTADEIHALRAKLASKVPQNSTLTSRNGQPMKRSKRCATPLSGFLGILCRIRRKRRRGVIPGWQMHEVWEHRKRSISALPIPPAVAARSMSCWWAPLAIITPVPATEPHLYRCSCSLRDFVYWGWGLRPVPHNVVCTTGATKLAYRQRD